MEGAESKSPIQQEDSPGISLNLSETIEEFQQCVHDILDEIEHDENFSEMTAENYDNKKSYLTRHLFELSHLHRLLAGQHVCLVQQVCKNCPSLIKFHRIEDKTSKSKSQQKESEIPPVKSNLELQKEVDELKLAISESEEFQQCVQDILDEIEHDENFSEMTAENYDNKKSYLTRHLIELSHLHRLLADQHVYLVQKVCKNCPSLIKFHRIEDETSKSKSQQNKSEIPPEKSNLELQKEVDELKLAISESDLKMKTMEEELEKCKKSLSIAKDTISTLNGEKSSKVYQQNLKMKYELQSGQKLVSEAREKLSVQMESFYKLEQQVESCEYELTLRDDQIKKLNTKNDRYKSEISKLEETLKSKEDIWNQNIITLKVQLKNKSKSFDDVKKLLNSVRSERNRTYGKLETLEEERCSQDKLIQELMTRLNTLQVEHEKVVSSFENAEEVNNQLTLKGVELEREVDRLREVISVITKEKIEAIKQLSFSLEHYMSRYKQLRRLFAASKTCCFGFSNCLKTQ